MMSRPSKTIFISRSLSDASAFHAFKKWEWKIIDFSLVEFQPLGFKQEKNYNWIFFYSPRGIEIYFENHIIREGTRYGVMGKSSAEIFHGLTQKYPDFIGEGQSDTIAQKFNELPGTEHVLFIKARNSRNTVQEYLESRGKHCTSLSVYENRAKTDFSIEKADILVFTSPLNAEAYFTQYTLRKEQIYAIGKTTALKIHELTGYKAPYPDVPSEEGIYDLILGELKRSGPA